MNLNLNVTKEHHFKRWPPCAVRSQVATGLSRETGRDFYRKMKMTEQRLFPKEKMTGEDFSPNKNPTWLELFLKEKDRARTSSEETNDRADDFSD